MKPSDFPGRDCKIFPQPPREEGLRGRTKIPEELDAELEKLPLETLQALMAAKEAKEAVNSAGWQVR